MNQFGALPKETVINGQPHQLSYIRPDEAELLKSLGGMGTPGPGGIPQYGWWSDTFGGSSSSSSSSSNDDKDDKPGILESLGNALTSAGSAAFEALSSAGSAAVDFVSDAGSAAAEVLTNIGTGAYELTSDVAEGLYDLGSDAVGAAGDTLTEIVTLGQADTSTYNPVEGVDFWTDQEGNKFDNVEDRDASNTTITNTKVKDPSTGLTFNEAYAANRAAGVQTFMWNGSEYGTGLPSTPTVFYDAFGNEYSTQAAASAADQTAAEQSAEVYYDAFGNEYGTQIEANQADLLSSAQSSLDGPSIQDLQTNLETVIGEGFSEGDPPYEQAKEQLNAELDNLKTKTDKGKEIVDAYIDKWGMSHLEDRFKVGRINPNTGQPYPLLDSNMVNPLDADTMPYTPDGLDFDEIIYLGGEPFESTVDGVDIGVGTIPAIDTSTDTSTEIIADDVSQTSPVVSPDGTVTFPESTTQEIITTTYPSYRTGMAGGMWDRFAGSPYSRFGVAPVHSTQVVNKIEQEDGSTVYYDAEGNVVDPYA